MAKLDYLETKIKSRTNITGSTARLDYMRMLAQPRTNFGQDFLGRVALPTIATNGPGSLMMDFGGANPTYNYDTEPHTLQYNDYFYDWKGVAGGGGYLWMMLTPESVPVFRDANALPISGGTYILKAPILGDGSLGPWSIHKKMTIAQYNSGVFFTNYATFGGQWMGKMAVHQGEPCYYRPGNDEYGVAFVYLDKTNMSTRFPNWTNSDYVIYNEFCTKLTSGILGFTGAPTDPDAPPELTSVTANAVVYIQHSSLDSLPGYGNTDVDLTWTSTTTWIHINIYGIGSGWVIAPPHTMFPHGWPVMIRRAREGHIIKESTVVLPTLPRAHNGTYYNDIGILSTQSVLYWMAYDPSYSTRLFSDIYGEVAPPPTIGAGEYIDFFCDSDYIYTWDNNKTVYKTNTNTWVQCGTLPNTIYWINYSTDNRAQSTVVSKYGKKYCIGASGDFHSSQQVSMDMSIEIGDIWRQGGTPDCTSGFYHGYNMYEVKRPYQSQYEMYYGNMY